MVRWIVFAVLALPAAELIVFILVASGIGFLRALALQIVASTVGYCLLRGAGAGQLIRRMTPSGYAQAVQFDAHAATLTRSLAGLLLLVPGFLSDIAGLALLLPPVRGWLARRVQTVVPQPAQNGGTRNSGPQPDGKVVDLERDDWHRVTESAPNAAHRDTRSTGDANRAD
jgi:UPF0716 protein FxsA